MRDARGVGVEPTDGGRMTLEDYLRPTSLHDVVVGCVRRKDAVLELDVELDAEEGLVSRLTLHAPTLTAEPGWEIFDWPPGVDGQMLRFDSTRRDGVDDVEVLVLIDRYDGGRPDVGVVRGRSEGLTVERLERVE